MEISKPMESAQNSCENKPSKKLQSKPPLTKKIEERFPNSS